MPTEYAGVLVIPLIIGLVEAVKRLGMSSIWAAPMSVGCGVAISLGYEAARQSPGGEAWLNALLWGMALGLSASGLYSGTKKVVSDQQ